MINGFGDGSVLTVERLYVNDCQNYWRSHSCDKLGVPHLQVTLVAPGLLK